MHTIKANQSTQGMKELKNSIDLLISGNQDQGSRLPRKNAVQFRRSQASFFRTFGLSVKEAHRISYFIYLVNGETNQAFIEAMETWVREIALLRGSIQEILDAIPILSVTRVDFDRAESCASVRREVIRYVQRRFAAPEGVLLKAAA